MGDTTGISWTDKTWSPWHGCAKVSPGCDNCYAAAGALRNPKTLGVWGQDGTRVPSKSYDKPLRWNDAATKDGTKVRVFPSICDPFEDFAGLVHERLRFFTLLEGTPYLTWLVLTKRPQNVLLMVPPSWQTKWPVNVWIGTTAEDQQRADERIPHLLQIPAPVRFVSVEPQLERVSLARWTIADLREEGRGISRLNQLHWVIQGGESGHGSRPFDLDWARVLRDQCAVAGVPYFFKQTGHNCISSNSDDKRHCGDMMLPSPFSLVVRGAGSDPIEWPEDLRIQECPGNP